MAYERIAGPLGGRRTDVAAAVIAATLANVNRSSNTHRYHVDDFLIDWGHAAKPMTPEDVWLQVQQAHATISAASRH